MGGLIGGLIGQGQASGVRGEANNQQAISNQILQAIQNAPDISKPLILQQYRQAGLLTPQMEQNISAGPSALSSIGTDQQSLDMQKQALQQMQQRAQGGLTAADRAALTQAQLGVQGDTEAKRQQILQQAQAQMGGAGQTGRTLAAELQGAQGGSNQQAANANQQAQIASQNALQALGMQSGAAGQLNQQQFNQASQKAQAADQMQRFNIQNQLGVQQQNVGAANQAQAGNIANAQALGNANVGAANQESANQLQRQMQQYGANVGTAQIKAGGASNYANQLNQQGNAIAQQDANIGSGVDKTALGVASAGMGYNDGGQIHDYRSGGKVVGKEVVPGDHPVNDNVPAMLSAREIVVPKSLAESKLGKQLVKLIHAHNSVKHQMNNED